ncbi:Uncharacterized conserved protein YeaO, DUF488 family [Paracoccus aminovorans]|uniref:Uncharacterized conserved protein YeaO, DUF488 family n=1 Tax=Paracoccus aminovorans TaxID=34004 RepID=A0A1I2ZMT5_9RHOB|nr:DUF488 domain-containing protein [Paracoccus aminovorans]CQR85124.1 hypothetical protein JCM7685_0540 [Paracoccus aminovorans]SFH38391.1 Uncharacterized conserved protein YeaO, DUF488 family [Paracoccus aminovorans]
MSAISIRRAYDPPDPGEGRRVLVDRIWPRGISRETLGADLWLREIAPSDDLRHWFGHDPQKWDEFRRRYGKELDANPQPVRELRQLANAGPVVLLYGARDTRHNNAVALRDYLAQ